MDCNAIGKLYYSARASTDNDLDPDHACAYIPNRIFHAWTEVHCHYSGRRDFYPTPNAPTHTDTYLYGYGHAYYHLDTHSYPSAWTADHFTEKHQEARSTVAMGEGYSNYALMVAGWTLDCDWDEIRPVYL